MCFVARRVRKPSHVWPSFHPSILQSSTPSLDLSAVPASRPPWCAACLPSTEVRGEQEREGREGEPPPPTTPAGTGIQTDTFTLLLIYIHYNIINDTHTLLHTTQVIETCHAIAIVMPPVPLPSCHAMSVLCVCNPALSGGSCGEVSGHKNKYMSQSLREEMEG